jgi:hypothetical protein
MVYNECHTGSTGIKIISEVTIGTTLGFFVINHKVGRSTNWAVLEFI